ncbi:MAG: hypothetical protein HOG73_09160 [Candidatus Marinimicrobia bacterium]|jgi:hypothetical protein|nr:hypothetical protein [Candidatus Neomarinimicrobiota bacterium]
MNKKIKQRLGDGKINTSSEMIEDQEEKLWESNPMEALRYEKIETRKKLNWWARFSLSMIIVFTFLFLIWLLFFGSLPTESRDLINIMVGAYVAVLAKSTDYWFKDKDDPEQKEGEVIGKNNNDMI